MINGKVEGIYIAPHQGEPAVLVNQAHVVPGMGIEGDRYFSQPGTSEGTKKTGLEITLIEVEAIESMQSEGIQITPGETRRNVVTRGIALNDLVGRLFSVGNIQIRGLRLCEPCSYLANKTDQRVLQSMSHRGGLRAEIIIEGVIHINDLITISE